MEAQGGWIAYSGLGTMIGEASAALARLDAGRLEELVLACEALNRELPQRTAEEREELFREIRAAAGEMEILGRVLEATRGNLRVMRRLCELRAARLEYSEGQARGWTVPGAGDGDD